MNTREEKPPPTTTKTTTTNKQAIQESETKKGKILLRHKQKSQKYIALNATDNGEDLQWHSSE